MRRFGVRLPTGAPVKLRHYILNEAGEPVPAPLLQWSKWLVTDLSFKLRRVCRERIGSVQVSTVFLGLDHNHSPNGPPILWETMIFADAQNHKLHGMIRRCTGGREQAEAMHVEVANEVRAALGISIQSP